MSTASETAALQTALADEHAAVYVFSALAAQASQQHNPVLWSALDAAFTAHRRCRDSLVARLEKDGTTPVAAAPSYRLPNPASTPAQLIAAGLRTERLATQGYAALVAHTSGADRAWAMRELDASAVRQLSLRGRPEIFPGTSGL